LRDLLKQAVELAGASAEVGLKDVFARIITIFDFSIAAV
jgi:hypothetical protein